MNFESVLIKILNYKYIYIYTKFRRKTTLEIDFGWNIWVLVKLFGSQFVT